MVVDPVISRSLTIGELRRECLADDDGTSVNQTLNRRSSLVLGRVQIVERAVTTGGLRAGDVEDVFDGDTLSGQGLLRRRSKV